MKLVSLIRKPECAVTIIVMLFLSGCSTAPTLLPPQEKSTDLTLEKNWQRHRSELQKIADWSLTGKLGLRSPNKNGSARLSWQQQDQSYHIDFSDPLGRNALQLVGNPDFTTISVPNQKPITTSEPEALLFSNIGWTLPISELPHWVLGSPAPNIPAVYNLGIDGRIATLSQSGWQLEFLSYQQVGQLWLPKKISIEQDDVKLKLIINQWTVHTSRNPDLTRNYQNIDSTAAHVK